MKKILFVAPVFFDYWKKIKQELERREFEVYFVNQSLEKQNIIKRVIGRYGNKKLRDKLLFKYYKNEISKIPSNIDIVFVIKGDSLNNSILELMKNIYCEAKFIMYQWDSSLNSPNMVKIAKYFDKVFTFDRKDSEKFSWEYRPLFYDVKDCKSVEKDYDLSFICTLKYERGDIYKRIKEIAIKKNQKFFSYLYIDFFTYLKRRFVNFDTNYTTIPISKVHFKTMSLEKTSEIYDKTKILVDYTTSSQSGLSMRTIESLGHNCKIITNNTNIAFEKFFCKENIYIYENNKINIPESFFYTPYKKIDDKIQFYYSLQGWVDTILNFENCYERDHVK